MEPTPPTPSNAPTPDIGRPVVEFVRTQRESAGYVLAGLAVLLLALTVFLALKAFRAPTTGDKTPDKPADSNPFDPEKPPELPKSASEAANLKRGDYNVGWIGSLFGCLVAGAAGSWLLARPPLPTEDRQRSEARVLLLAVGGLLGSALIAFGVVYFWRWSDSLVAWLDRGETRQARWVIIPILMIVAGAGLIFAAIQPARAEERNNASIRRLVYGANFGLTTLLLVVALVVANVLFALRVPNKLDATETGFYSLSEPTKELLGRLNRPVTAYAVLPDQDHRMIGDVRQLLLAAEDAGGGKFKVKTVSMMANKTELARLLKEYQQLDLALQGRMGRFGAVVLAAGEDGKQNAVIPIPEFFSEQDQQPTFVGETKLFKELTLLADNQVKPVVYFTQSNGELSIDPGVQAPEDQKATRLRTYLEKNYLDVRPLTLSRDKPTVPEDAAVVVVAGPTVPFTEAAAGALRTYVNTPRGAEGKKGKLVVLAGIVPGVGGRGVMKTGLETLLADLNVQLGTKYVYNLPTDRNPDEDLVLARFTRSVRLERHPVAQALTRTSLIPMLRARQVSAVRGGPPTPQVTTLLESASVTWLEDEQVTDIDKAVTAWLEKPEVQAKRDVTEEGRPLGVVVSEARVGRAAVFGSSVIVSDQIARGLPPEVVPTTFDLVGVSIDWLRERPSVAAVGIEAKKYREYTFPEPAAVDATRLVYLPLALGLLAVGGLGAGVWVIRRK